MKIKRNPSTVHSPFSTYSHQVELQREARLLAISGQIGVDVNGNVGGDVAEQLRIAWHNVGENLTAADMTFDDVVKLTVYLVHESIDTLDRRALFKEAFSDFTACMTVLYVSALGEPSIKVELDVWASAE